MNFDNPAWTATPVRTGVRVVMSLLRRRMPLLRRLSVPYDGGRSLIYADLATPLKPGDEIAFFPPVTGG